MNSPHYAFRSRQCWHNRSVMTVYKPSNRNRTGCGSHCVIVSHQPLAAISFGSVTVLDASYGLLPASQERKESSAPKAAKWTMHRATGTGAIQRYPLWQFTSIWVSGDNDHEQSIDRSIGARCSNADEENTGEPSLGKAHVLNGMSNGSGNKAVRKRKQALAPNGHGSVCRSAAGMGCLWLTGRAAMRGKPKL